MGITFNNVQRESGEDYCEVVGRMRYLNSVAPPICQTLLANPGEAASPGQQQICRFSLTLAKLVLADWNLILEQICYQAWAAPVQ